MEIIQLIKNSPYATIWLINLCFFFRAQYLGIVVDDDRYVPYILRRKRLAADGKLKIGGWIRFLHELTQGGGLFAYAQGKRIFTKYDHLFAVFIHGCNCSLIYSITGSLLPALLYLINPVNNQTTLWLNGRRYQLSLLLVLFCWKFSASIFLIYPILVWMHASGIGLTALFLMTDHWRVATIATSILALMFLNKKSFKNIHGRIETRGRDFNKDANGDLNENQKIRLKKVVLFIKTVGYQFWHCILPMQPKMFHDNFLEDYSLTPAGYREAYRANWEFWKGLLTLAGLIYLVCCGNFWAYWFLVFIAQWCNIFTVVMTASDRYCTIANVGAMCLLAEFLMKLPEPFNYFGVCFFASLYILKYAPLFNCYKNHERYFLYHINMNPEAFKARVLLAKVYMANKDPYSAFALIRRGLGYNPYKFELLLSFVNILFAIGLYRQAFQAMEFCEEHAPASEKKDVEENFRKIREEELKDVYQQYLKEKKRTARVHHNFGRPVVKKECD